MNNLLSEQTEIKFSESIYSLEDIILGKFKGENVVKNSLIITERVAECN